MYGLYSRAAYDGARMVYISGGVKVYHVDPSQLWSLVKTRRRSIGPADAAKTLAIF